MNERVTVRFGQEVLTGTIIEDGASWATVRIDDDAPVMAGVNAPFLRENMTFIESAEDSACEERLTIGPRTDVETYRMRHSSLYAGDHVENHSRRINGMEYDFSRIRWASGKASVAVYIAGTTNRIHNWGYDPR